MKKKGLARKGKFWYTIEEEITSGDGGSEDQTQRGVLL
jgi:hypothetical protein